MSETEHHRGTLVPVQPEDELEVVIKTILKGLGVTDFKEKFGY